MVHWLSERDRVKNASQNALVTLGILGVPGAFSILMFKNRATITDSINIQKYGNTTAATIPLCLYDWESQLKRGDNLILAAFGGGFTWGAVYLKWAYDGNKYA